MSAAEFYSHTTFPANGAQGSSSAMRAELELVEAGFGKLPDLSGNGSKVVAINSGGTAMEAITTTGTGSGVRATSPTLVTPVLGVATVTSINGLTITTSTGTLTITNGKTLSVSNTLTLTATDGSTAAFGAGGTVAYTANKLSAFAATTSAELAGVISDETGSGALVFANTPTLVTPVLGTPTSGTLTNCTGLPISTGVSGLGANVAAFLATASSANLAAAVSDETGSGALVFANTPTLVTPILGTPTSGTLTNCTGLPISTGVSGLGANVGTFLATPSSANLAAAVTDETGSGALVFATSPSLTTPTLGVATATSINKVTVTAPATSATLTLADGSSLVTSGANSITLTSTGATNVTLPTTGTLATRAGSETLTNKTLTDPTLGNSNLLGIKLPVYNAESATTGTTGAVTVDWSAGATYLQAEPTGNITYTFTAPGQSNVHLQLRIASDGTSTARTLTWPAAVKWYGAAMTTTTANKGHVVNFWYDGTTYHATYMTEV